jgi:hypothetical protein
MKTYGGHNFLPRHSMSGEWSDSGPGRFALWEIFPRYPLDRRLGWPQSRCRLCGEDKKSQAVQPVASRYADWAIPTHVIYVHFEISGSWCSYLPRLHWCIETNSERLFAPLSTECINAPSLSGSVFLPPDTYAPNHYRPCTDYRTSVMKYLIQFWCNVISKQTYLILCVRFH